MMNRQFTRLKSALTAALVAGLASLANAQVITTVAGGGYGDGGLAVRASIVNVGEMGTDAAGNVYFTTIGVRKIGTDGIISTVFTESHNNTIAVDAAGYIYFVDAANSRIRRRSPAGLIDTVAGSGVAGYDGDGGLATNAKLNNTRSIAIDPNTGAVYISDNGALRKFTVGGNITTIAGGNGNGFDGDGGPALLAHFGGVGSVAVDGAGNVYLIDVFNGRIRKIDTGGIVTTVAGNGQSGSFGDNGPATSASIANLNRFTVTADGTIYISDNADRIRRVSTSGTIVTIAGTGHQGFSGDGGPALAADLYAPVGIAVDSNGNIFFGDAGNMRIRKITPGGTISTYGGGSNGDEGPALLASMYPEHLALDSNGDILLSDVNMFRRVGADGVIHRFAGTGESGFSGDGLAATQAKFGQVKGIALVGGRTVLGDGRYNSRLRAVDSGGIVNTIAGNGNCTASGDGGQAALATFCYPVGLASDAAGNLYFADGDNNQIRKIAPDGIITTVAGNGQYGFSGDNGPATQARLSYPTYIAVDGGNLYISDYSNNRIRKVSPDGIIHTIAGNGLQHAFTEYIPATNASLSAVGGIAIDADGNVYFTDDRRILRVDPSGILTTLAGNGNLDLFAPDGVDARHSALGSPKGLVINKATRTLYFTDAFRVRAMQLPQSIPAGSVLSIEGNPIPSPSKITGVPTAPHAGLNGAGTNMNAYAVNPARCGNTQPAITRAWHHNVDVSNVGAVDDFALAPNEALTYAFAVGAEGQGSVLVDHGVSFYLAPTFMTITTTPCDFDVSKVVAGAGRDLCYATASSANSIAIKATYAATAPGFCRLVPGNVYYLNVRFQDARPAVDGGAPTADSCTNAGQASCGGTLSMRIPDEIVVSNVSLIYTYAGQTVTLTGRGLSGAAVTISGLPATVTSNGPAQVTFTVPPGVGPYTQNLVVTTLATQTYTMPIFILTAPAAPSLMELIPDNQKIVVNYADFNNALAPTQYYTVTCNPGAITAQSTNAFSTTVSGLTNGQPYSCSVTATNAVGTSPASAIGTATPVAPPVFLGAYSRKVHGAAGPFDLPLTGPASIFDARVEPRFNNGDTLIVFKFDRPITAPGDFVAYNRAGSNVQYVSLTAANNEVLVQMVPLADGQRLSLQLFRVNGTLAGATAYAAFLEGDVTGSKAVNAADISVAKARIGPVTQQNYQSDLDLSGTVTQDDVLRIKQRVGNFILNN